MTTNTNKGFSTETGWVSQMNKKTEESPLILKSGTDKSKTKEPGQKEKSSFIKFLKRIYSFLLIACIF
jgi:hypothetical protein